MNVCRSNKKLKIYRKSNLTFRYDEDFSWISSITLGTLKKTTNSISYMQLFTWAAKPTKYKKNCFLNRGHMFSIFFHFTDIHS